jgi:hypothetical protein
MIYTWGLLAVGRCRTGASVATVECAWSAHASCGEATRSAIMSAHQPTANALIKVRRLQQYLSASHSKASPGNNSQGAVYKLYVRFYCPWLPMNLAHSALLAWHAASQQTLNYIAVKGAVVTMIASHMCGHETCPCPCPDVGRDSTLTCMHTCTDRTDDTDS